MEDVSDTATELMDLGALPEVERDPNPDNKKSLAVHRCRKARDRLDKTSSTSAGAMADADFKRACHNIALSMAQKRVAPTDIHAHIAQSLLVHVLITW